MYFPSRIAVGSALRMRPAYVGMRFLSTVPGPTTLGSGAEPVPLTAAAQAAAPTISEEILSKDAESGEAAKDAKDTGVIEKTNQETLMYFDNVFPRYTSLWHLSSLYTIFATKTNPETLKKQIMDLASPETNKLPLKITSLIPMERDGGVFVKFEFPEGASVAEVNTEIQKNAIAESTQTWSAMFTKSTAFPVKGSPWIEDLKRPPARTVKVMFEGAALSEEEIYALLRRYGTIVDIIPPNKDSPALATVIFQSFRGAICAKNCVNGLKIRDTVLHIQYLPQEHTQVLKKMFVDHPRISIPLLIAFISIFAVIVFDPIREFFIEQKITKKYTLDWWWLQKLASMTSNTFTSLKHFLGATEEVQIKTLWSERLDKIKDVKLWIEENVNTFIVVRGPRDTGKYDFVVDHVLRDRNNILVIDCDKIVKSRSDSKFLSNVASQLGYFPIFPWLNSFTTFIDLGIKGLTGQTSGLSESIDVQFRNMLNTALMSIRRIALNHREDSDLKEEDFLEQHPENKPVIVIDRFASKSEQNSFVYKEIAEWASMLMQMNVAHVIFLTDDVSSIQLLTDALPNQVFKNMILEDAGRESALEYVLSELPDAQDRFSGLAEMIEPLGGRMLDLQAFVRRVKTGEDPQEAVEAMIEQCAEQITQMFLTNNQGIKAAQAWDIIEMLSSKGTLAFTDILFKPLFKSDPETGLLTLEKAGLITVTRDRGVMHEISPARPLYQAAFNNLIHDETMSRILKTGYYLRNITFETERIKKFEAELANLGSVRDNKMFRSRLQYLSTKIDASSAVIADCEQKIKELANPKKK